MTKEKHKCESELSCKASASLNKSVKADLQSEDKPLEELLNEENNCQNAVDDSSKTE